MRELLSLATSGNAEGRRTKVRIGVKKGVDSIGP
jgi:hypothetical protein